MKHSLRNWSIWAGSGPVAAFLALTTPVTAATAEYPLEPPDRSSPRATIATFLDSVDKAWDLFQAKDPSFEEPLFDAQESLDLSKIPPLVFEDASAEAALLLKDVLDRLELPPAEEIPDAVEVASTPITRWTIPHTEIDLVLVSEGDRQGEWLFSTRTVAMAEKYYDKVRNLPLQPGRKGGHIEEMRSGSSAFVLLKFVDVMPSWFRSEAGGMLIWQWFGLVVVVLLLALAVAAVSWIGKRWGNSQLLGHRMGAFLMPLALIFVPWLSMVILGRIFQLPGAPALVLQLAISVIGYLGLAWLAAVGITRLGELVVRIWFRHARPLKKQLVHVIFRIATIAIVTVVLLKALQILGVPVAGLIAGLGVGGLAIALAAQSTLENFIGGIILYADQPVRVGDVCKFGSKRGTVEDVGLRSVKIRTLDRTIVTVPNGDFAKLQLENLSDRDKVLLREELCLRYETTQDQLRQVLTGLETMLREHPRMADEPMRVRFTGFGQYFLKVELFAYAMTSAWPEFLEIREDVLLKVIEIVEGAGTRLALPTEVLYSADGPPLKVQER